MRVLLDTSVLIDLIEGRLSARMREALVSPAASVHVSVASLWEIAIKFRLGKLPLKTPLADLTELLENLGLVVVVIEAAHVLGAVDPEPTTRDPFDRLLLAQCAVENMRLVTIDRQLTAHPLAWREG
jgi:PIN domain nuclease of toxin-antitoxin system